MVDYRDNAWTLVDGGLPGNAWILIDANPCVGIEFPGNRQGLPDSRIIRNETFLYGAKDGFEGGNKQARH